MVYRPPEEDAATQADLIWLVEHPEKSLGSKYHDAGRCWGLIEAALAEIRRLRSELARSGGKGQDP